MGFRTLKMKGKMFIVGYEGLEETIIIPSQINGLPVWLEGEFSNQYNCAKEIYIEEGVECIGNRAFEGCKNLKKVHLPKGLKQIGDRAFADCQNLVNINLPDTVESIGEMAFMDDYSLKNIVLPQNLSYLGALALSDTSIAVIKLPEKLDIINPGLFDSCESLEKVDASNVKIIMQSALHETYSLRELYLPQIKALQNDSIYSENLEKVYINEDVEYIDPEAICPKTKIIYISKGGTI